MTLHDAPDESPLAFPPRDWIAIRTNTADVRGPYSFRDARYFTGPEWKWAKVEEVWAKLMRPDADQQTDQLRKLQEALAAKQAVIDRIHEWSATNRT
jgi:hypothetical protein